MRGLSPLLPEKLFASVREEWAKKGRSLPTIPTYEVKTVTGEVEVHEHDATTLFVEGNPEQTKLNQEKWREFSRDNRELQNEYNARLMRAMFLSIIATPTDEWRGEMAFLGVDIPPKGTPAEKYSYIENRVVQNAEDIVRLMTCVFRLTGVASEAAIADVEATFRSAVQGAVLEASQQESEGKSLEE